MPLLSNVQRTIVQAQHTLQGDDLTTICNLASVEGADINSLWASITAWDFEQLLGFTLHLFITADSSAVQAQVAQLLPKFGSKVVRPLVKISHHFHKTNAISTLAQQSIQQLSPQVLSVGLTEVLTGNNAQNLLPTVVTCLTSLPVQRYEVVLSYLAEQLPLPNYRALERQILDECSRAQLPTQVESRKVDARPSAITHRSNAPVQKEIHLVR